MSQFVKKLHKIDKKIKRKIGLGWLHKIERGGRRVFRKVWANPIGRIILSVAAVFVGGAILGAWSWTGQAAGAAAGTTGGTLAGAPSITPTLTYTSQGVAGTGTLVGSTTAGTATGIVGAAQSAPSAAPAVTQSAPAINPTLTTAPQSGASGIVNNIMNAAKTMGKSLATTVGENKLLAAGGAMMLGQMLTPTEAELHKKAQEEHWDNLNVGSINIGRPPPARTPLLWTSGKPVYDDRGMVRDDGMISRRLRGTPNAGMETV